jgi:hypothetical protein
VSDGKVTVFNSAGCTHVAIDVVGYARGTGNGFTPVSPSRIKDTRSGLGGPLGAIGPGAIHTLRVVGTGVPAGVDSVVLNVTAVDPTSQGYLTVYPADQAQPNSSNLNFIAGRVIPNLVISKVSASGDVNIYNAFGSTHVVADVYGYFAAGGDRFVSLSPARIFDVRNTEAFAPGETREVQVAGAGGVPSGATAVVANVTAVDPTSAGYLTIFPADQPNPGSSNLNFTEGRTIPNTVIVKLSPDGKLRVFNAFGSTGVIVDVAGYFTSAPPT